MLVNSTNSTCILIFIYFLHLPGGLTCQNCNKLLSNDLDYVVEHCKLCYYGSRPDKSFAFVCFKCDYHTYQRYHMKTHVRIHLGVKPFQCNLCDYSSNDSRNLNRHKRIRHCVES
uniref:RE1-silencing transcription factor n=1 Tax=Cacopsylla melanoneura TaxID=428564 RepID=A0A8D9EYV0_9HEMI